MKKTFFFLMILGLATYCFLWWKQSERLENELIAFAQERNIEYDQIVRKGFPTHLELEVKNLKMANAPLFAGSLFIKTDLLGQKGKIWGDGKWTLGDLSLAGNFSVMKEQFLETFMRNNWRKGLTVVAEGLVLSQKEQLLLEVENLQIAHVQTKADLSTFDIDVTSTTPNAIFDSSDFDPKTHYHCTLHLSPTSVEIEDLLCSNDYAQSAFEGKFSVEKRESDMTVKFSLLSDIDFLKPYPPIGKDQFLTAIDPFFTNLPQMKNLIETNWDQFLLLFPDFSSFKTMKTDIDFEITGDIKNGFEPTSLAIRKMNYHFDEYGIDMSGEVKTPSENRAFQFAIKIDRDFLTDLIRFAGDLNEFVAKSNLTALPPLNQEMQEKMVYFLKSLSDSPSENVLKFTLQGDQNTDLKIGSKPIQEVQIGLLGLLFEPPVSVEKTEPSAENILMRPDSVAL